MRYSLLHHQYKKVEKESETKNANYSIKKLPNNIIFVLFYHDFLSVSLPARFQLSL